MLDNLTVTKRVHFASAKRGKRRIKSGRKPRRHVPTGRIPRVSRLMALAIKFDDLLRSGAVRDQAELAELGHVSRARVTQIMNLLHLAPDIQEELLFLPRVTTGRDPVTEREVRAIASEVEWQRQRRMWGVLLRKLGAAQNRFFS